MGEKALHPTGRCKNKLIYLLTGILGREIGFQFRKSSVSLGNAHISVCKNKQTCIMSCTQFIYSIYTRNKKISVLNIWLVWYPECL
jgi:hypothetical protein